MSQETIKIDDLQRVELRKNDTLIVRLPRRVPPEHIARTLETLKATFPNNEIVLLAQDVEVFVISPGERSPDDSIDWSGFPDPTDAIARRAL